MKKLMIMKKSKTKVTKKLQLAIFMLLLYVLGAVSVYGLDIVIIPVVYYEKEGSNYAQKNYERNITADISSRLNIYHEVTIDKTPLRDRLAGVTDSDARRAAEYHQINDVLYGSIKNDGNSISAEFKIYNKRRNDYGLFFASDANGQYERLIKTISEHILEWYHTDRDKVDTLRDEVRELRTELTSVKEGVKTKTKPVKEKAERVEAEKEFGLRFPVNVGYWSYIDRAWAELVQGTVEVRLGVDIFPELQLPALYGKKNEFSLGFYINYRNGVTSRRDRAILNGVIVNPEIAYHLNFYSKNWICLGAGIFYESDFWQMEEPEYERTRKFQQSLTGYSAAFDYSYRFNRWATLNFGLNMNGYFVSDTSLIFRFYAGSVITLLGGNNEK